MEEIQIPPRIWEIDIVTLRDLGFDDASIRAHAQIEFDEDTDRAMSFAECKPIELSQALALKIRERNRAHWGPMAAC